MNSICIANNDHLAIDQSLIAHNLQQNDIPYKTFCYGCKKKVTEKTKIPYLQPNHRKITN